MLANTLSAMRPLPHSPSHSDPPAESARVRAASAALGAVVTSLLVTPLDVVKVRMQAAPATVAACMFDSSEASCFCCPHSPVSKAPRGILPGMAAILRTEGPTGLWRGLAPTLAMSAPATVAYFVVNDSLRSAIHRRVSPNSRDGPPPMWISAAAGCSARVLAATLVSPIELLRTQMQASGDPLPRGISRLASAVRDARAPTLLYRGLPPTLWRDVPFSALYWALYGRLRQWPPIAQRPGAPWAETAGTAFLAGAAAGFVAATATTPFDVAKTRQQVSVRSGGARPALAPLLADIWRTEGVRGLFSGLAPRVAKVAPSCAVMIATYELGKARLGSI